MSSLSFVEDQVTFISKAEEGQSNNILWHEMRRGLISASHFHDIVLGIDLDLTCGKIMGTDTTQKTKFQQLALNWGRRKEAKARSLYKCAHGLKKKCLAETGVFGKPKVSIHKM